jgi:membrane-associated phospholipid phosphatase
MQKVYKALAYIFHPVFIPAGFMAYALFISYNPAFKVINENPIHWFFNVANTTIVYPLLLTFLLWKLNFIDSLSMKTNKERYIPLIACMLFYFWVFWVFHQSLGANQWIQIFLLGNFISAVISFLINISEKLSLHTAAYANLFMYSLLLNLNTSFQDIVLLTLSTILVLLIPYSRFALNAHSKREIILGAIAGALSAFLAYLFL